MRFDLHFVADDVFCINYHPFTREPIAFRLQLLRSQDLYVLGLLRDHATHAVGPVRGDTLVIHEFSWSRNGMRVNYLEREYVFTDTDTGLQWFRKDFIPLLKK